MNRGNAVLNKRSSLWIVLLIAGLQTWIARGMTQLNSSFDKPFEVIIKNYQYDFNYSGDDENSYGNSHSTYTYSWGQGCHSFGEDCGYYGPTEQYYYSWGEASWEWKDPFELGTYEWGTSGNCGERGNSETTLYWPLDAALITSKGSVSYQGSNWHMKTTLNTTCECVLETGGKATSNQRNIFTMTASASGNTDLGNNLFFNYDISPTAITLGSVGSMGADGKRYAALPNNASIDLTPKTSAQYATYNIDTVRTAVYLKANGTDLRDATPEFCVGQKVTFGLAGLPAYVDMVSNWKLPQKYVNKIVTSPLGINSPNYSIDNSLFRNSPAISCWFVNGAGGSVSVGPSIRFSNGQTVSFAVKGGIIVHRPSFHDFVCDEHSFRWPVYLYGVPYLQGHMLWHVTVDSKYDGLAGITQLLKATGGVFDTGGDWWLDGNTEIYGDPGTKLPHPYDASNVNTHMVQIEDEPAATPIPAPAIRMQVDFKDYLRFKPGLGTNDGNIYVTLGQNEWNMDGEAWILYGMTRSNMPPAANLIDSDEFPSWPNYRPSP